MNHILHIDASGRGKSSVSRQLSSEIVQKLRHYLNFIGIDDVEIVQAEALNRNGDKAIEVARASIASMQS